MDHDRWERRQQREAEVRVGVAGVWIAGIAGLLLLLGGGDQTTWVAIVEVLALALGLVLALNLREDTP